MSRYFKIFKRCGFLALRENFCYLPRAQIFPSEETSFFFNSCFFAQFSVVYNVNKNEKCLRCYSEYFSLVT